MAHRNNHYNRSGYTPHTRVFGRAMSMPTSILSDNAVDPLMLNDNPNEDFVKAEELRRAAQRAWSALDTKSRMAKALRARHRTIEVFTEGQLVFVWRQPPVGAGRWVGPGIVIQQTTGGAWINMRGALWRVSQEQLRSATSEENLGAELVNRYLHDLKWDIQRNTGPKKYVDVTREGPRREPGEDGDQSGDESPADGGSDMDEDGEPEPLDVPTRPASSVRPQPLSEPSIPGGSVPAAIAPPIPGTPGRQLGSSSRAYGPVPIQLSGGSPYAPPMSHRGFVTQNKSVCGQCWDFNLYCNSVETEHDTFTAQTGVAKVYLDSEFGISYFQLKKGPPPEAEIDIFKLPKEAQKLFLDPECGSDAKEWKNMLDPGKRGDDPAVIVHRGKEAERLAREYPDRIIPTRWHRKWKDLGDEHVTPLPKWITEEFKVPSHSGAKSRWIIQGFHDPDIALLDRSVPTPTHTDIPYCCQLLASLMCKAFVADVKGAFTQGLRGQRPGRLFATPPPGGIPGETGNVLIDTYRDTC